MTPIPILPAAVPPPAGIAQSSAMKEAATQLEATFLAEMLKSAGLGSQSGSFGGGIGEEQFSSFLLQAQAEELARAGGIGLAESLFNAMKAKLDA